MEEYNPIKLACDIINHSDLDDDYKDAIADLLYNANDEFLEHFGVKGMRKGVRRWTNEDGTLTEAGKQHYGIGSGVSDRRARNDAEHAREIYARNKVELDYINEKINKLNNKIIAKTEQGKIPHNKELDKLQKLYKDSKTYEENAKKAMYTSAEIANSRGSIRLRDRVYYDKIRSGTDFLRVLFGGSILAPTISTYSSVKNIDKNGKKIEIDDFNVSRK